MIPEKATMETLDWMSLHIEQTEAFTEQRQNALVSGAFLLVVD